MISTVTPHSLDLLVNPSEELFREVFLVVGLTLVTHKLLQRTKGRECFVVYIHYTILLIAHGFAGKNEKPHHAEVTVTNLRQETEVQQYTTECHFKLFGN